MGKGYGRREYQRVHASYAADGWICGRVTMEHFARLVRPRNEVDQWCGELGNDPPRSGRDGAANDT